ncbi:epoxide hydrolase family protein [Blastococcus sp. Marseille-P5729]|uniref:epoxide hydrolase family protein n=1 Tax=Blastococcus sp. Marseille-P5729 TaxID=2086582 RepID=UPI000D10DACF|nr:epoxide hydrolase [Blastococcus sp. Marseille-P5729]
MTDFEHTDTAVHPFTATAWDEELTDLRARLAATRWATPLPSDDWSRGVPQDYLRELVSAWIDFDWRAYLDRMNRLPQFTTVIEGQQIHFLHIRSEQPGAVPLLLTHGWPGSFLEFVDLIGPLTSPEKHGGDASDAFHVVIPSIPGFGFSTPLTTDGWTTNAIARAWVELMDRLGYDRFVNQGGDLGAGIAPEIGRVAPDRVLGVHVNGALGDFVAEVDDETAAQLTDLERDRLERTATFMQQEFGYISLQSTRPGLLGTMLADSPVGQLSWIVDKLHAWTHPADRLPHEVLGMDWLLANVSLYWFTRSAGSAALVGYASEEGWGEELTSSGVPTAAIQFAHDIGIRRFAEQSNNIVSWTDVTDRGGHFAALEEPHLLIDDLRSFVRTLR